MAETSRGNPVESIYDYYCFHCQAGCFDLVDSTAFMDVGCILLYSETPPSLVTGNRALCVNVSDIVISVGSFLFFFFYQELDLCVSIACKLLTFPFVSTITGVSLKADVELGLGTFPIAWSVVYLRKTKNKTQNKETNKQKTDSFVPLTIDLLQP